MVFAPRRLPAARVGLLAVLTILAVRLSAPVMARDHFVAPPEPLPSAAERAPPDAPWDTLDKAFAAAEPDDRLILLPGSYGEIVLSGRSFEGRPLTIVPERPGSMHATAVRLRGVGNVVLRALRVWPDGPDAAGALVETDSASTRIRFERLDVRGSADAPDYRSWEPQVWAKQGRLTGVGLGGRGDALIASELTGLGIGVTVIGARGEVRGIRLRGFSVDGIHVLGTEGRIHGNHLEDCIQMDETPTTARQAWSPGAERGAEPATAGLRFDGNVLLEWTGRPDHLLCCDLRGIGLADGRFPDLTVRNNLVIISAADVIAVDGAEGATIANNVAMGYHGIPQAARTNIVARFPARIFRDVARGDFRPKPGSGLIGTAARAYAPGTDLVGIARGDAPDFGALQAPRDLSQ
ncbi:hypothetical protein [Jannaschia seohaensis]|uniref:Right handed beta helix region n=1 Tax=Jannaschia seohaensis TaxID=475081 RepID=A0A2Y9A1B3_9RHOB|nr:hypothetical protein [Jannaschia seohaensis]PWJ22053.1 hypothetical protein BCF38_101462 [Jannaschia seohaensis]SSA38331.1 hypothetical protein SAMN05421539_101462 [Jannaschia seohaensis]